MWRSLVKMWRSSVGNASACCKAGPSSIILLSGEAMKIQENGARQMMKDEIMYDCIA